MAIHWTIPFKSLRSGTVYTVNVYDATHSGAAVVLNGGSEPMSTDEDATDDEFAPIRTQSGYMRIVDNGKDAGGSAFNWKDILAATDNDRPVTITHQEGNATVTDWIGFMQSQTFSGVLYGNPQEREFPVIGALSILAGEDVNINRGLQNFAFLLKEACDTITSKSSGVIGITGIYVQGGADARQWLLHKVDWQNFAEEDGNGVMRAKYSLFEVLEDMCRFWGWTARICNTTIYLTCADDSVEQDYLVLTPANLATLAAAETDTTTGSVVSPSTVTLADTSALHIFASTEQTDSKVQGPHRAVVKASVSPISDIMEFAPQSVRNTMEAGGYTWVGGSNVGYFTTPSIYSFESSKLDGDATNDGGFARRQIYTSADAESASICDMILHKRYSDGTTPIAQLRTKRPMPFGSGTLKLSGTVYAGAELLTTDEPGRSFNVRIGIGMTYATAKWLKFSRTVGDHSDASWESTQQEVKVAVEYAPKLALMAWDNYHEVVTGWMNAVPLKTPRGGGSLYGYLFIDFMGTEDRADVRLPEQFELANFKVEYSRDEEIIASGGLSRKVTKDRVDTQEYTAMNTNASKEEWNANCIFASDNNTEFGFGLILDGSGGIVEKVPYGNTTDHPEQHLANRVASYWATAKRKIEGELQAHVVQAITGGTVKIGDILPCHKVSIDSYTFCPIAISRNWRDDVVKLSLLQI